MEQRTEGLLPRMGSQPNQVTWAPGYRATGLPDYCGCPPAEKCGWHPLVTAGIITTNFGAMYHKENISRILQKFYKIKLINLISYIYCIAIVITITILWTTSHDVHSMNMEYGSKVNFVLYMHFNNMHFHNCIFVRFQSQLLQVSQDWTHWTMFNTKLEDIRKCLNLS